MKIVEATNKVYVKSGFYKDKENPQGKVLFGNFTKLPPDLVKLQSQRGFHGAFCLGAAAAIAAAGLKGLGMR